MRMRHVVLASLLLVTGCEEGTGPGVESGQISYTFEGFGQTITVTAQGNPTFRSGQLEENPFAFGATDLEDLNANDELFAIPLILFAGDSDGFEEYTYMQLMLSQRTAGSYTFDPECDLQTGRCVFGALELSAAGDDGGIVTFKNGTLQISSVSPTRVQGTFSGTAEMLRFGPTGAVTVETITITNGSFDVPVYSTSQLEALGAEV